MIPFEECIDLAAERVGGQALVANDEFFAGKENLLKPGRGVFIAGKYTDRGKWMDGWETRRRRQPGHDWCVVRLGIPGRIRGIVVDTHHFKGNHPEACSLDACAIAEEMVPDNLATHGGWSEIVSKSPLERDFENSFPVDAGERFTHVRLNIYPDGGVARLRILGEARPDWPMLIASPEPVDLLAIEHGGRVVDASDRFFSDPLNLLMPGRGLDMGDGWETRRRRGPGHDWTMLALGRRCTIDEVLVDTRHFKGNYPDSCSLEGADVSGAATLQTADWREILPRAVLGPDAEHRFGELRLPSPITHVRFHIYPDGGVSRLRLFGRPVD